MNKVSKIEIYGFQGVLKLILYKLHTIIFYKSSRLIRYPISVRGRKYIYFGFNLTTGIGCRIEAFPYFNKHKIVSFGDNIEINDYVHIAGIEKVSLGNNVLIASKVYISDIQHGTYNGSLNHDSPGSIPKNRTLSSKPVVIGDNVWIGESVSVMPGVTIGNGSIIGANSVVSKDIPENSIAVGIPAKVIKRYNSVSKHWESI